MELKDVNEILGKISNIGSIGTIILEEEDKDYYSEKNQGDTSNKTVIVKLKNSKFDGIFLKIIYESDSYGDNESIHSIQFVEPVVKSITDYVPVK